MCPKRERKALSDIRDSRRAAIAHAACVEFGTHGYERANIDAIAKRAGIGKSTIYEYYPSKEALLGAVGEWAFETAAERIHKVLAPDVDFRSMAHQYIEVMRDIIRHTGAGMVMLHSDGRAFAIIRAYANRFRDFIVSNLESAVVRAQQRGEIARDIDAHAAASLVAVLSGPILPVDDTDWERNIALTEDVLFRGLDPRT